MSKKFVPLTSTVADLVTQLKKFPGETKIEIIENKLWVGSVVFNIPYKDPNLLVLHEYLKKYPLDKVTFAKFPNKSEFVSKYADTLSEHKKHDDTLSRENLYAVIEKHLQKISRIL